MTKVYSDLLASDKGDVSALCLLDLTAAFDIVDHGLLMLRLERQFGLCSVVCQWFGSYLSGSSFQAVYGGSTLSVVIIACSVPQGSVMGPSLFILYTVDLADVAAQLTTLTFIHMQMTLSYIGSVNARTQRWLSSDLKCAYQMSATGWWRTD